MDERHRAWSQNQWDSIIWSDEVWFEVCIGNSWIQVIRTKEKVYYTDCFTKIRKIILIFKKLILSAQILIYLSGFINFRKKLLHFEGSLNIDYHISKNTLPVAHYEWRELLILASLEMKIATLSLWIIYYISKCEWIFFLMKTMINDGVDGVTQFLCRIISQQRQLSSGYQDNVIHLHYFFL